MCADDHEDEYINFVVIDEFHEKFGPAVSFLFFFLLHESPKSSYVLSYILQHLSLTSMKCVMRSREAVKVNKNLGEDIRGHPATLRHGCVLMQWCMFLTKFRRETTKRASDILGRCIPTMVFVGKRG